MTALTVLATVFAGTARAANILTKDADITFNSDEMTYDNKLGVITAKGGVEVSNGDMTLFADTITYNQKTDLLSAHGSVSMVEPNGDVMFAEYMELTGDMKDGIVKDIRIILSDHSRIAANGARRSGGNILEMRKAVYSPCNLCRDNPSKPPLWQIKAVKVVHDKKLKTLEYTDATLEIAGVPVAYLPYFSHPDPTVKRKSGFLAPSFGGSSDLGAVLRTPYFFNLSPSSDFTFNPIVTTKEGPVMAGEYRRLFTNGKVKVRASITNDSNSDLRGHIAGKGRFDINRTWRWGLDVNRASDDTYMRRYGFSSDNTIANSNNSLTTHVFTEGFRKRNYMALNTYTFQGLSNGSTDGTTPYVLPMLDYNHVGEPDRFGGRSSLDANFLMLSRTSGRDTRRLSMNGGWKLPYIGPLGGVYALSTSLRGDIYHVSGLDRGVNKSKYSGATYRVIPQAKLDWRYPMVRNEGPVYQLIEPIASAIVSPNSSKPSKIPNEDSLEFEFDDTNLFSSSRFSGLDRVEGGARINYGLRWGMFGRKGGHTTALIGQSYRPRTDDTFAIGSGLEDNFSDIVGKLTVAPKGTLKFSYRTRLNKKNFEARRNEIKLTAGPPALRIDTRYTFFGAQENSQFPGREEISMNLSSQVSRYWRSVGTGVRNLSSGGGMRSLGLSLVYEDECTIFTTNLTRTYFEDRELKPNVAIVFRVALKSLGEVHSGFSNL